MDQFQNDAEEKLVPQTFKEVDLARRMAHHNRFMIRNDLCKPLTLNIEPEGCFSPLGIGEQVSVIEAFTAAPVTVKLTTSDNSEPILSIWPGDGNVRVEKDGIDVLVLAREGAGVESLSH
jgi:hypothetical protein